MFMQIKTLLCPVCKKDPVNPVHHSKWTKKDGTEVIRHICYDCRAQRQRDYYRNGGKDKLYSYARNYALRHPERTRIYQKLCELLKTGKIQKPNNCSMCLVDCKPEAHHDDYSKPLDVRWLCRRCHRGHHTALKHAKIKNMDTEEEKKEEVQAPIVCPVDPAEAAQCDSCQ